MRRHLLLSLALFVLGSPHVSANCRVTFVRTEHAPGWETRKVVFSAGFLYSEIPQETVHRAELLGPGGRRISMNRTSSSRSQSFRIELESNGEAWLEGQWKIALFGDDGLWDSYPLDVPSAVTGDFDPYPPVPVPNHEGDPLAVLLPSVNGSFVIIALGASSDSYADGGREYRYPAGGPHQLNRASRNDLDSEEVVGEMGNAPQSPYQVSFWSETHFVFHTTTPEELTLTISRSGDGPHQRLQAAGLQAESAYALREGDEPGALDHQTEFVPWSNAIDIPHVNVAPARFFTLEHLVE